MLEYARGLLTLGQEKPKLIILICEKSMNHIQDDKLDPQVLLLLKVNHTRARFILVVWSLGRVSSFKSKST
jgi:hypothetical protein